MSQKLKTTIFTTLLVLWVIFLATVFTWWKIERRGGCSISFPGQTTQGATCSYYFWLDGYMNKFFGTEKHEQPPYVPFITPNFDKYRDDVKTTDI
jgi:hypothetical protein